MTNTNGSIMKFVISQGLGGKPLSPKTQETEIFVQNTVTNVKNIALKTNFQAKQ